jgi:hypothetical protein
MGPRKTLVGALLGGEGSRISDEEIERIAALLAKARKDMRR